MLTPVLLWSLLPVVYRIDSWWHTSLLYIVRVIIQSNDDGDVKICRLSNWSWQSWFGLEQTSGMSLKWWNKSLSFITTPRNHRCKYLHFFNQSNNNVDNHSFFFALPHKDRKYALYPALSLIVIFRGYQAGSHGQGLPSQTPETKPITQN